MKPEKWAELKALQRSGRRRLPFDQGTHVDNMRAQLGMRPQFGTRDNPRKSRKPARRGKVKGK